MDNLFEQMGNISKANAYDIVSNKLGEVEEQNKNFRKSINDLLDIIQCTKPSEIIDTPAAVLMKLADVCLNT